MLNAYGDYPPSTLENAKKIIKESLNHNLTRYTSDNDLDKIIYAAFVSNNLINETNNCITCSYTGWSVHGRAVITDFVIAKLKSNNILRRQKLKRMLVGVLKSTYYLIKARNQSSRTIYHPDSIYVNTVIKGEFMSLIGI